MNTYIDIICILIVSYASVATDVKKTMYLCILALKFLSSSITIIYVSEIYGTE